MPRVKVFFTVDTEVWTGGWSDIDARFPGAFRSYVYGPTPRGDYALPMKLRVLEDHGLKGVFFVEPMFSARFGLAPLEEIVGLIADAGQEVQLHLHAEWVNEARVPLLPWTPERKIQHLSMFSGEDQARLVGWAKRRVEEAGAGPITAFRAGSFAFNRDTLRALEANGIGVDSSYNQVHGGASSGVWTGQGETVPVQPFAAGAVLEVPVTVYNDMLRLRPLHLQASSLREMKAVLRRAAEMEYETVVIVSHNFELLDRRDFSPDDVVVGRFLGLCEFLQKNADAFETCGFADSACRPWDAQPRIAAGDAAGLAIRYVEQIRRRL